MIKTKFFLLSIFIFAIAISFYAKIIYVNPVSQKNKGVKDNFRIMKLVTFLEEQDLVRDWLLSLDSFFIDLITISYIIFWVTSPDNYSPYLLILFFFFKQIGMSVTNFPLPENYLFKFTYPSFLIPDDKTNDLYYSGHVGLLTCLTLLLSMRGFNKLAILEGFFTLFTLLLLLTTGAHYSNDFIFAIVSSYFLFCIVKRIRYSINNKVLKTYASFTNKLILVQEILKSKF